MDRVTADEVLRSKLGNFTGPLEVCDEKGKIVGHFLPLETYKALLYSSLKEPHFSKEDLEDRFNAPGGKSLQEIWKGLKSS